MDLQVPEVEYSYSLGISWMKKKICCKLGLYSQMTSVQDNANRRNINIIKAIVMG